MLKLGREYAERAATFFQKIGLKTEVEKRVNGTRGVHNIDVWVTGKIQSFDVRWIIECKDWKSRVPKEKVLALQSIALDIGSDRAFLLSESGFQAGAIRCARFTNITLTSLQDLQEQTREQFAKEELWALYLRVSQVIDDLNNEPVRIYLAGPATGCLYANPDIDDKIRSMKRLAKALVESFRGQLPVKYIDNIGETLIFDTIEHLIEVSRFTLADAEEFLTEFRKLYPDRWYEIQIMGNKKMIDSNKKT